MTGTTLGHYEIGAKLGEGGMGAVYRARDRRLGRDVAIKVLPAGFASAPDRLVRFEREAHVLASLNDPNIATLYGFEEQAGLPFFVMELVGGETLRDRIARAALPVSDALGIAKQVADALEAAHGKGTSTATSLRQRAGAARAPRALTRVTTPASRGPGSWTCGSEVIPDRARR